MLFCDICPRAKKLRKKREKDIVIAELVVNRKKKTLFGSLV